MSILIQHQTKVICQGPFGRQGKFADANTAGRGVPGRSRRFACGLAGLALPVLFSTPVFADAKSAIEEAVGVCAASIMRPLTFPEMAKGTGYGLAAAIEVSATQKAQSFSKGDRSVNINELTFSDASTKSCVVTLTDPFTLDDVKALKARIEADPDIGKLDGEPGSPQAPGMAMNMHFGSFKRPGANPIITVNVFATDRITTITFSRTDLKAKD